jgi:hypothetical protein
MSMPALAGVPLADMPLQGGHMSNVRLEHAPVAKTAMLIRKGE